MSEPFIGEIKMFAGNYAPLNYAFCQGQLLAVNQNQALFSIVGTTYGGNGSTTFGLPDLQGRVPVGWGQGAGLQPVTFGAKAGVQNVTLTSTQLPPQAIAGNASIAIPAGTADAGTDTPSTTAYLAKSIDGTGSGAEPYVYSTTAPSQGQTLAPFNAPIVAQTSGGGQAFSVLNPYQAVSFIIALTGIWPSRN